jgi:hypothetical protein
MPRTLRHTSLKSLSLSLLLITTSINVLNARHVHVKIGSANQLLFTPDEQSVFEIRSISASISNEDKKNFQSIIINTVNPRYQKNIKFITSAKGKTNNVFNRHTSLRKGCILETIDEFGFVLSNGASDNQDLKQVRLIDWLKNKTFEYQQQFEKDTADLNLNIQTSPHLKTAYDELKADLLALQSIPATNNPKGAIVLADLHTIILGFGGNHTFYSMPDKFAVIRLSQALYKAMCQAY